jgi:HD-GYP domain-containing protein (c-di-GMP phosphodiesterase class II)
MLNYSSFKIKPTIFTIVTSLILIVVTILLTLQYFSSEKLAIKATVNSINHISEKIENKLLSMDRQADDFISMIEISDGVQDLPIENKKHKMLTTFTTIFNNKPLIYAIYVGYENGDFFELINLQSNKKVKSTFNAKKDEIWLSKKIIQTNKGRILIDEFLDKDLNTLRTHTSQAKYNPTKRPWYHGAIKSSSTAKTDPYVFANLKNLGITYSKKVKNSNNVIGIDLSLRNLSLFLKAQKIEQGSQLYLFNNNGTITASNIDKQQQPKNIQKVLNQALQKNNQTITIDDIEYFVSKNTINSRHGANTTLLSFVPKETIMAPYMEKINYSIFVSFLLILLVMPFLLRATSLIVNPIRDLVKENEKIKNRKFNEVSAIKTNIKELKELSNSFVSMSHAIQEHEKAQVKLMDSFIELIAGAIDAKSEYTGGHCNKVPIVTLMLANAATKSKDEVFKDFELKSDEEIRELSIAAWLHDCGKVTTPEYVVDKATKLETIYNRIHEIRTRFEVIYRDLKIKSLEKIQSGEDAKSVNEWLEKEQQKLKDDFEFIAKANVGGEFMKEEDKQRIQDIAKTKWKREFDDSIGLSAEEELRYVKSDSHNEFLLADKSSHIIKRTESSNKRYDGLNFKIDTPKYLYNLGEVYNLSVERGTLTNEERFKIQEHIMMSIKMLEQLPFPKYLQRVPEYAGAHHETLIGTGYPKGLKENEMSLPAKIMAIADVFEALTASDRPYKKGKPLSVAINIMSFMVKDKHLDENLFKLLLTSGVYLDFAKKYLKPEQIDKVDIEKYIS